MKKLRIVNKEDVIKLLIEHGFKIVDRESSENYCAIVGSRTKPLVIKY